jgi:hypothetical protein
MNWKAWKSDRNLIEALSQYLPGHTKKSRPLPIKHKIAGGPAEIGPSTFRVHFQSVSSRPTCSTSSVVHCLDSFVGCVQIMFLYGDLWYFDLFMRRSSGPHVLDVRFIVSWSGNWGTCVLADCVVCKGSLTLLFGLGRQRLHCEDT